MQVLKGFPGLYFSLPLSLSTQCTEIRPEAGFKGSGTARAVAGRESVVPVPCFMAGHQIPDLLGVGTAWDARFFSAGSVAPARLDPLGVTGR